MFTDSKWNWFIHCHSPFFINSGALEKQTRRVAGSVEMGFNPSVACGRVIRSSVGAVENHNPPLFFDIRKVNINTCKTDGI